MLSGLPDMPGVRLVGPAETTDRLAVVSVVVDGVHAHDVGQVLDDAGSPSGSATTAPSRCTAGSGRPPPPARAPTCTPRRRRSDAFLDALAGVRSFFGVDR
jgi:cysteine desulfurase/selenocysteine lyase